MRFPFDFSRWSLATLFHYKSRIKGEPVDAVRVSNPYHAVAILPGPEACLAARGCARQRFLSAEAPRVPLETCDAARCDCRYQHFKDRRSEIRRAADGGIGRGRGTWHGVERRRTGRRITDD